MEITGIRIRLVDEAKLKAFASVVFDDCFMINDLKVIQGRDDYFVSMPSRKRRNGRYRDVAHPLNSETRVWLQDAIVSKYLRVLNGEVEEDDKPVVPRPKSLRKEHSSQVVIPTPCEEMEVEVPATMEEIQKKHLQDSFWTV